MSDRPERILSHRFWALVIGIPLASTLVFPWKVQGDEVQGLDMPDVMQHLGWGLMPFVGIALIVAAFAPMPPLVRRGLLAVSGVSALLLGSFLLRAEQTRWYLPDSALVERPAVALMVLSWIFAAGLEMAMHARPRSRGVSLAALVGWTLLLLSFAVPLRDGWDWEWSIYGSALENMARRRFDMQHALYCGFVLLMLIGWVQTLRRIGKDRDKAAKKRFRTSWIVYLVVPLPFLALYAMMLWHGLDRPEVVVEAHNPWSFVFASTFGGALGIANTATLLAGWKPPRWILHASGAGFAGAGIFLVILAVLPDPRERRSAEFVNAIGEATVLGLRAQPVPERFLGGYEEFDLRAAPAALEGHVAPGAPLRLLATAVRYRANDRSDGITGWAVSINDELRWTGNTDAVGRIMGVEVLAEVDPVLADLIGFAFDESESCLPALSESERDTLGNAFADVDSTLDGTLCRAGSESSLLTSNAHLRGAVDRYRVVVELPSGEPMTLEGALSFETRLWVGPPSAMPASPER